jgi:hypothetical protein
MDKVIQNVLTPIGDDKIRKYLPDARIFKYSELSNYNNIEELLPYNKSYFIILAESAPNYGHWVSVSRLNDVIQYFDSYGDYPSTFLKWNTKEKNDELGQDHQYLNKLFDKTPLEVIYNCYDFQDDDNDIATCGRHQILYILLMKEDGLTLKDYVKKLKQLKVNPDLLISKVII